MSASRIVRHIAATAVAAVSVVAVVAMPASADSGHGHGYGRHQSYSTVALGDIQYGGQGQYGSHGRGDRSNRSLNREWVEVTNTGRRAVDLDGWTLSDRDGNRYRFDDLRLPGRATVRVHTGRGHDTRRDVYQDRRNYIWSRYDKATLRDDHGRTVDTQSLGYRR
jgi:hypothetical protein